MTGMGQKRHYEMKRPWIDHAMCKECQFQNSAGYAGKKQEVQVHHDEGVANHIDPESCAVTREGLGEATEEPPREETALIPIFDGHNDSVQRLQEYRPEGIDFLVRSADGHLDLPRAVDGGVRGGLFAMMARPEHPPVDDLTITEAGYEVRLAEPLDLAYARRKILEQLTALKQLEARADGKVRIATSVDQIDAITGAGSFAVVLHMEGADGIDADLLELEAMHRSGLRSLGLVWSRPNIFGHKVPFAWPRLIPARG
jgi:Membrane dipeptidase (Peptidase family M19)